LIEKLKHILFKRKIAYQQVFNPESVHVKEVLHDLARFCRAVDSTYHKDARAHAVLEGRREVFLRIQKHLKLSDDQFLKNYGKVEYHE